MKEIKQYTPEEFELEYAEDGDLPVPSAGALTALFGPGNISFTQANGREVNIEKIGCYFIDSHFILFDWLKLPEKLRPLVVVISGLSGGNYLDYTPITQAQIGKRLGIDVETVRERLDELVAWEKREKKALIYIRKNDRDQSRKYQTTEYLPIIIKYAGDFIRKLQAKGLQPVNRHQAITDKTVHLYDDTANEVIVTMPEAALGNVLQPRSEKNVTPRQQKINFIESKENRILSDFDEYREALKSQNYDRQEAWAKIILKAEERFFQ